MDASHRALPRRAPTLAAAILVLAPLACADAPAAESAVDRETFISTYVDLRLSALGSPTGELSDAERTRVLEDHDVTEEDLLSFADAHGGDPAHMKMVWEEVQRRLRAAAGEDSTATDGGT